MPTVDLNIKRAWRQSGEVGRIHYVVATHDGGERRLYVEEESALGRVLNQALHAQDYFGPRSAGEH